LTPILLVYLWLITHKYYVKRTGLIVDNIKSIIEELDSIVPAKNKHAIIESRATHLIASALNLITLIRESYEPEVAEDLVKRLHRSIASADQKKFVRKIKELRKNS
jgi:hypothetical protein